ncbi:GGDEF domain-containing protein [Massilia sp. YMA4]|uniref:diguanylate cyclase n=1 Tax=[Empedobacter] haloabium TaxID=592317 RepID=A0ABZ1UTN3_9BURK|nr:GGDEF domain-containing protein [Massilia sp. YMA4]
MSTTAMPHPHRNALFAASAALLAFPFLYAALGVAKPATAWRPMDIAGEGGTALMALVWFLIVLGSRPGGRVTRLLAGGLAAIMLGSWADCLDEFWRIDKAAWWDNCLEALVPAGMAVLTAGLFYWRQEQVRLTEHLHKRERLFREHRAFDRLTQLADASYLREQLRRERALHPDGSCALVLLDLDGFHAINRLHGRAEGDRVLQAVSHMLLLNLRNDDLLCRYAGDRFALLMPGLDAAAAREVALHLCAMVERMRHHAGRERVALTLRFGCADTREACGANGDGVEAVLAGLARRVDATAPA